MSLLSLVLACPGWELLAEVIKKSSLAALVPKYLGRLPHIWSTGKVYIVDKMNS
jgi:hypothetical protein